MCVWQSEDNPQELFSYFILWVRGIKLRLRLGVAASTFTPEPFIPMFVYLFVFKSTLLYFFLSFLFSFFKSNTSQICYHLWTEAVLISILFQFSFKIMCVGGMYGEGVGKYSCPWRLEEGTRYLWIRSYRRLWATAKSSLQLLQK